MSIRLLVADDSITIQKVIGIIFSGEEYSLTVVDNGLAAVEKARELSPDVLLIDALMPGMSGYEVCEAVRAMPALAAKPILLLTGSFEPFDEEKAKKCGADDFLAKPFESQQIVTKVKELAELGASRTATGVPAPASSAVSELVSDFPLPEAEPFATFELPETEPAVSFAQPSAEPASAFAFPSPEPGIAFTTDSTAFAAPESVQPAAPADIWGAFTPASEPSPDTTVAPEPLVSGFSDSFEPDVFAIVNEESESQLIQPATASSSPQTTGTQWIPVEEQTFEFDEEKIADIPHATLSAQGAAVQDTGFGDIVFEEGEAVQKIPVPTAVVIEPSVAGIPAPEPDSGFFAGTAPSFGFETAAVEPVAPAVTVPPVVAAEPAPVAALQSRPDTPLTATLSEEQIRAAISGLSREVIERIVWEVVPDLAETMIRDAIRKIKEGV